MEAAALVTTANATIQDADSVSAGLRTISLRLVGTSEAEEQLSAMNEEVDASVKATNSKNNKSSKIILLSHPTTIKVLIF